MVSPVLLLVGFVAGLLTIVSPCILPVLPAVIASGITVGGRRRALMIAVGLAVAFGSSALFSIRILQALGLPLGLRYDIAIGVLFVLAAGFLVPQIGALLERPFARLGGSRAPTRDRGGLILGATLGLLYLPCGGPILATIAAVGSPHSTLSGAAVALTAAYSLGIALPIFGLVLFTNRMSTATGWLRGHALTLRRVGGALLAASAVAITFGAATSLQTAVPSYSASIERTLTQSGSITGDLARIGNPNESAAAKRIQHSVTAPRPVHAVPMADQIPMLSAADLPTYGKAPAFTGISQWLNTPNHDALTLPQLQGKVVLIDFWTYSCINCRRALPHVEAWYDRYRRDGFVVVGVHTPEFDFEHAASNVTTAVHELGVTYPVALDNDYDTWSAWGNNSWPAEYLIDQTGQVRYGSIGEGDYGTTEAAIRALLATHHHTLPPPTSVPDRTPTQALTPESYLGYERLARYAGSPTVVRNQATSYHFPTALAASTLAFDGNWTVQAEDALAGSGARLRINVHASDVYLVLSGTGTVTATLNGRPLPTQHVAGIPSLYSLVRGSAPVTGVLQLSFSPGVKAYDFTFG